MVGPCSQVGYRASPDFVPAPEKRSANAPENEVVGFWVVFMSQVAYARVDLLRILQVVQIGNRVILQIQREAI